MSAELSDDDKVLLSHPDVVALAAKFYSGVSYGDLSPEDRVKFSRYLRTRRRARRRRS